MSDTTTQPKSVALPFVLLLPMALLTAAGVVAIVALQQACAPLSTANFISAIAGLAACALLILGPSRLILTVVFVLALLDHSFRSFFIVPLGGVEWHPRELLLLVLFAHAAVKLAQRRLWIRWTPLHFGMLLYTAVFVYAAWRGLWIGHDPRAIIAECRAPLFLGAFWVFAGTVQSPRDLHYYGYLALCVIALLALATTGAFGYFASTGPIPNTQNALGEFVPRLIAGYNVQSIRPSGHAWFEAALVVLAGMLLCPREPWYRKAIYAGLMILLAAAISAGMMRTALVSVAVSLMALVWLNLPRIGQGLICSLVALVVACVALFAVLQPDLSPRDVVYRDYSIHARAVETAGALDAICEEPFFGSGFGSSFEALGLAQPRSGTSAIPKDYRSLHNAWLYITWKAGLAGLGMAVFAMLIMLLYSQHIVNRLPSMNQRCLGRALQAALIGQLVASVAMPRLTYPNGALLLGIWAMAFVLLARNAEAGASRSLVSASPGNH